jgi:segregation and condensation protein A
VPYEVRTPVFEGPFDLLLHLITSQQVDLYEVRISHIIDAYLTELERMEALDLDVATEFALIAATLIELKCRRLLPGRDDVEVDEELGVWEERDVLLARLLECKTFKDAAQEMARRIRHADRSVARTAGPEEPYRWMAPDPLERLRLEVLRAAALRMLSATPETIVDTEHVAPVRASVKDAVQTVLRLLPELDKQGFVDLTQFGNFGELMVRRLAEGEQVLDAASLDDWEDGGPLAGGIDPHAPAAIDIVAAEEARLDAEIDAEIDAALAGVSADAYAPDDETGPADERAHT